MVTPTVYRNFSKLGASLSLTPIANLSPVVAAAVLRFKPEIITLIRKNEGFPGHAQDQERQLQPQEQGQTNSRRWLHGYAYCGSWRESVYSFWFVHCQKGPFQPA